MGEVKLGDSESNRTLKLESLRCRRGLGGKNTKVVKDCQNCSKASSGMEESRTMDEKKFLLKKMC